MAALKVRFVVAGGSPVRAMATMLDALTRINVRIMRSEPIPALYRAGVRYQRENYSGEHPEDWRDCRAVLEAGGGDCEDLAAYRAAELRVSGEPARCVYHAVRRPGGSRLYHIVVERYGPGSKVYEDPSRMLGMGDDG